MHFKYLFFIVLMLFFFNSFSQDQDPTFTVLVVNANTRIPIDGAMVIIDKYHNQVKKTENGVVSFSMPVSHDSELNIDVIKDGFIPEKNREGNLYINPNSKHLNEIEIELIPTSENDYIFYGEIIDKNGKDISNAIVELKIANLQLDTVTDNSGNYFFRISKDEVKDNELSFEVKTNSSNCEKQKIVVTKPFGAKIIQNNFILSLIHI